MSLLLYLNPFNNENLKLPPWCPREYPYTQAVNRCDSSLNPFNYSLKCEKISDIVGMPANNQTYEQMAIARAIDLKKLDNKIYIMYSGGVDSSTAVLAFLMSWNKQELQRVYILCSTKSVKEFPELWSAIANEFKGRIKTSYKHVENSLRDGYVITGEHGDQIFGSDVLKTVCYIYGDEGIQKPWQCCMPEVYSFLFGKEISERFIDKYKQTLKYCPFPIKTNFDWVWWFNFTNKWQHVKYRMLTYKPWLDQKNNFVKIHHFFDTPEWQKWSIDNHDLKIQKTMESYKFAAKEFIVNNTGFTDYFKKPKIGSLRSLWLNIGFYDAIDADLNYISAAKAMEYINECI